ncbi:MAG TPA: hypothetical protein VFG68_13010 [Fimbriiglobus sp.]|nr:hypothetical protein [Fimbriiglobus sp.]
MASITDLESAVERLFGPVPRPSGDPARALEQVEARLGWPIPRVLRDFVLRFGWGGPLTTAQETLLPPCSWRLQGGALASGVENQGVVLWGIAEADLVLEDPPVRAAENREPLAWVWDHDRLSDFFVTLAYWHGIVAAKFSVGNVGVAETTTPEERAKLEHRFGEIPLGPNRWGVRVFAGEDKWFLLQKTGRLTCLVVGPANSDRVVQEFERVRELTSIDFSFAERA